MQASTAFRLMFQKARFSTQHHRMQKPFETLKSYLLPPNTHLLFLACSPTTDLRLRNGEDPRIALCEAQEAVMLEIQEQINDYRFVEPLSVPLECVSEFPFQCTHMFSMILVSLLYVWRRSKRTLGLGSLYGENDLLDLDGDPIRERQMAEKQLAALGDIL